MAPNDTVEDRISAWAPLRERAFALIWFAAVVSNIGTWMHDVAAAWLMTTLAPEPLMVALVQAATSLPIFMFALPAGALADLIDRRRLLLGLQACAGVLAVILAVVVATGAITPGLLLLFTFLLGTIAALGAPAWQAMTPDLVPKPLLAQAVALNGVGINIARAIGPALGGLVITALGLAWPFALNALSFVAVILALWLWRREAKPASALPAERFFAAIRAGLRYARSSAQLRATLVRSAGFFLFGSALWALLPLVARGPLAGGPGLYGALLTGVGTGAVAGALLLPPLKARLGADRDGGAGHGGPGAGHGDAGPLPAGAGGPAGLHCWPGSPGSRCSPASTSPPRWRCRAGSARAGSRSTSPCSSAAWRWAASSGAGSPAPWASAAPCWSPPPARCSASPPPGPGSSWAAALSTSRPRRTGRCRSWPSPWQARAARCMVTVEYEIDPADAPELRRRDHRAQPRAPARRRLLLAAVHRRREPAPAGRGLHAGQLARPSAPA